MTLFSAHQRTRVSLAFSSSSWHCGCCGSVFDEDLSIRINDEHKLDLCADGHMGGGNWNGDDDKAYLIALALLGYRVEATWQRLQPDGSIVTVSSSEVDNNDLAYLLDYPLIHEDSDGYREFHSMLEHDHGSELKPIYVTMLVAEPQNVPEEQCYDYTVKASLDINSDKFTLETGEGKNWAYGSLRDLIFFILEQVADVEQTHESHHEPYSFESEWDE
jgi:hypothetical protein